jgi:type II secretory pathway pseudopilin PulG
MTLVEVLVVVAVLGILTSMTVVGLRGALENRRTTGAGRELWAELQQARQRAMSRNEPVRLVVQEEPLGDRTRMRVQWQQLPCESTWDNTSCPSAACASELTCGRGCACSDLGQQVELPLDMDVRALHGVCFLAGSGRAVRATDCMRGRLGNRAEVLAAQPPPLPLRKAGLDTPLALLRIEPLTGLVSLQDCGAPDAPAECR